MKIYKGILAALGSGILFGIMPFTVKKLYEGGANVESLLFFRTFLALPFVFFLSKGRKKIQFTKKERIGALVIILLGLFFTPMLLFMSYKFISTGLATTLHFTYPILVVYGLLIFFKEKLNWLKVSFSILVVLGIFLIYQPGGQTSVIGLVLALMSGLTYATYVTLIGKTKLKEMDPIRFTQICFIIVSITAFTYAVASGKFIYTYTFQTWLILIFNSLGITFLAVLFVKYAIENIGSEAVSILSTVEPVTSIIIGTLVLHEALAPRQFIGSATIVISIIVYTYLMGKKNKVTIK